MFKANYKYNINIHHIDQNKIAIRYMRFHHLFCSLHVTYKGDVSLVTKVRMMLWYLTRTKIKFIILIKSFIKLVQKLLNQQMFKQNSPNVFQHHY